MKFLKVHAVPHTTVFGYSKDKHMAENRK